MFFTPGLSYAIQALVFLPEDGGIVRVRELAEKAKVPQAFLAKLMQRLARAGLVEGHRGPTGGYRLGKSSREITIRDLAIVLEEDLGLPQCVLTHKACGEEPCVMHHVWGTIRPQFQDRLLNLSIHDLKNHEEPASTIVPLVPPMAFVGNGVS